MAYMYLLLSTRKSSSFPSSRVKLHMQYKRTSMLREYMTPASSESSTSADFRMSGTSSHVSPYSIGQEYTYEIDLTDRDLDKYEVKIESEKLGSHRVSNPEHLPVLGH